MPKLAVGVFMGGKSIEREVSFNSGRTICDHLDTSRYKVIPIFQTESGLLYILPWKFLYRGKISDFQQRLTQEAESIRWDDLKNRIDFMYIAVHGRYAEDGTLQGFLELLGIPYLGSDVAASALGMDKIMQKKVLSLHGITVPNGITVNPEEYKNCTKDPSLLSAKIKQTKLSYPLIIKPYKEGSSLGVSKVADENELLPALQKAIHADPHTAQTALVEERVTGMEFSCICIRDYTNKCWIPLPPTEIVPEKGSQLFDYEQKYMPGRATKFTPPRRSHEIIEAIQKTAIATTEALGFSTISRIDGFVRDDGTIVIVDPNTLSGMAPSSFLFREAAEINMSHTKLINHLIETELHHYGMLNTLIKKEEAEAKTMHQTKLRVAVLLGGRSNEREISLESGRNICYKLSPHKYDVLPLFVTDEDELELFKLNQAQLVRNTTKEIARALKKDDHIAWHDLPTHADFVFIGLHGAEGENGTIQGTLEMLGLPYNGSSILASSMGMDKHKAAQFIYKECNDSFIGIPQQHLVSEKSWHTTKEKELEAIINTIRAPYIVKPHNDGCSMMVFKANNKSKLTNALQKICAESKRSALVEECISGMELTVGVIGNDKPQALPPSQTVTTHEVLSIEEKFLPGAGENQTPAPLPAKTLKQIQQAAEKIYSALGCAGYARIDCFYQTAAQSPTNRERIVFIEINTLPAMTPATCLFHQAAEIDMKPMDFIDMIIELGIKKHGKHQPMPAMQKIQKAIVSK